MKKAILSVIALCAGIASQAQTIEEGYHPEPSAILNNGLPYAADFFTSEISLNNVYWWKQVKLRDETVDSIPEVPSDSINNSLSRTCIKRMLPFRYVWARNTAKQALEYNMSVPYGSYSPVGVGFGVDASGNDLVLDVSRGNAFVAFTFTNTSDSNLTVAVGLQDYKKRLVNSMGKATTKPEDFHTEQIKFDVPARQSVSKQIDFNESATLKPYYAFYPKDACDRGLTPIKQSAFAFDSLTSVSFTVYSFKNRGSVDGYKPYKFTGTFEISKFRVGTVLTTGLKDEASYLSSGILTAYPNPVTDGTLFLNAEANNIRVVDVLGNVVLTSGTTKEVNVSSLNKGVYTIHTSKGGARFVIE